MSDERLFPTSKPKASPGTPPPTAGGSYVDGKLVERTQDPEPTPGGVIHREEED